MPDPVTRRDARLGGAAAQLHPHMQAPTMAATRVLRDNGDMKFVFASDSFKGTISSARICELLEQAARRAFPTCECVGLLMADGGEGTLDAIARTRPGKRIRFPAHEALLRPMQGEIFLCGKDAFVETAQTCGLALLEEAERNPLATSSYGVGESIVAALDAGAERITVGLGGSSTNDGGMGCLRALGMAFFDSAGAQLAGTGADLAAAARIDTRNLDGRLGDAEFRIMCDVSNPLLGPCGATYVYGPQKGADAATLDRLEAGMQRFAQVVEKAHPAVDFATPGFGAAGGLGMALSVFCGGQREPGVHAMLRWADFDRVAADADLVITGEGQMDEQTLQGKVPLGVLERAWELGVPVAAVCGRIAGSEAMRQRLLDAGFDHIIETGAGQSVEHALLHAEENYMQAATEFFRDVKARQGDNRHEPQQSGSSSS